MRILVVTNLYPPHQIGGYELGCRDVVEALRARGHEIQVLTSTFRLGDEIVPEEGVIRALQFVGSAAEGKHQKLRECRILWNAMRRHRPEVVYFWNQAGLSFWLPVLARSLGYRVSFFLSDTNFVSWRVGAFLVRWAPPLSNALPVRMLRGIFGKTFLLRGWSVIQRQPCQFASQFLRNCAERSGITVAKETSRVVHWGIDLHKFAAHREAQRSPIRLLYVGQLIPQKGVHTAIDALALLSKGSEYGTMTLSVVGGGLHPKYEKELRERAVQTGLGDRVNFPGKIPHAKLPRIYAEHDILLFPSEWEEPFAITPLEAMASRMPVIGTLTGGSPELFHDRETAMVFRAGDAQDCARAIRELITDRELAEAIRERAFREVATSHTIAAMVDSLEQILTKIVAAPPSVG